MSAVPASVSRIDVLMPTFDSARFVVRALDSVLAQSYTAWELAIVDDGSTDDTRQAVAPYLADPRVRYYRHAANRGLGAALNAALERTTAPLVAYLPADDVYYREHLERLVGALSRNDGAVLAHAHVRHHYSRIAEGPVDGHGLQLVQTMHRRTPDRWVEREELVTDDLGRMYWSKLAGRGAFVSSGALTCEWVDHPHQRHKVIREPEGGINPYRLRYRVKGPLRFHSTTGNAIDEAAQYRHYRERPRAPVAADGLRILLVGELAYNADRIVALEERGHTLFGLWMRDPYWYNTVGPLPFGHCEDLDVSRWRAEIARVAPDVVYALLNWQAVPFACEMLQNNPGVPFVWHFKEGPFICLEKGTWRELTELYSRADGTIDSSPEMAQWFETLGLARTRPHLVLDGDLPKRDWFTTARARRLSLDDGEVHTVVPGRPIGLHPENVAELAAQAIHLHFYGDFTHGQWREWIAKTNRLAPGYLHLHDNVDQRRWVAEFSRYDAGWLHYFRSANGGDARRANWDDLNYPARMSTLAAAGLPMIQYDNRDALVASDRLARALDIGVFCRDLRELGGQLRDAARMSALRANVWRQRETFTFDHHADRLVAFFREVIASAGRSTRLARLRRAAH
jgi:glycosyltransferase involved in cell wall biosynthesis